MKLSIRFILIILVFSMSCHKSPVSSLRITQLSCNGLQENAVTESTPVFNWILSSDERNQNQTAWQIMVSSDLKKCRSGKADLWDSGKTSSSQSAWIPYEGKELQAGRQYYWKVRVWDGQDNPSEWSTPAIFFTGLFNEQDWEGAEWIAFEEIPDSLKLVPGVHGKGDNLGEVAKKRSVVPYFRKEYQIDKKISQALVFVCGLGHYKLYINGNKIADRFLSPGWTEYRKSCLYNIFDVTDYLQIGTNTLGAIAGNGFFNINRERYRKLVIAYDSPMIILRLKLIYDDGSEKNIITDESWKTSPSPITYSSIYGGEDYDARLEQEGWNMPGFDDSDWDQALPVKGPGGTLKPEMDYPLRVMETFEPKNIYSPGENIFVYDYGQNASGIIQLKVKGSKGQEVRFHPGELINEDSLVTQRASGEPYYFSYILKGEGEETWIPGFSYYGFRYIEVEGAVPANAFNPGNLPIISDLKLLHTRNSSPGAGTFKCSNDLFNSIYTLIDWAVRSNLASVATDCPHREKLGWLEQTHLMGNSIKYLYDIHNLYDKIIDDMIEAQLENGLVPDIAPEYVPFVKGFRDSPEWGSACVILPWDMYSWYGDIGAVRKAYPMMKKYVNYLKEKSENHILSHGLGDWYDLGPKFPGEAQLTPKAVTATSIYFYDVRLLAEMAGLLDKDQDSVYYMDLAGEIRFAFNKKFFDQEIRIYSTGSQTAYAMPLFYGMVDEEYRSDVVANLVRSIRDNNNALTAGDVGYRYLIRVLEQEGHSQLIFEMNSKTDVPGYGYQLSKGATALTESWAALKYVSNNHMMLGHLMEWLYSGLGGIRQTIDSKAYEYILISPEPVGNISWAETSFKSIHGEIVSSWKIQDGLFILNVNIPVNCRASVSLPQSDPAKISENGIPANISNDIKEIRVIEGKTHCEIFSGDYEFQVLMSEKN